MNPDLAELRLTIQGKQASKFVTSEQARRLFVGESARFVPIIMRLFDYEECKDCEYQVTLEVER